MKNDYEWNKIENRIRNVVNFTIFIKICILTLKMTTLYSTHKLNLFLQKP